MTKENYTYDVKCNTCHTLFKVQLFESHEKNLFLVDKKDWYCEKCKKEYFKDQAKKLSRKQETIGFLPLTGTEKMISWGEKIRSDLVNKVDYLKKSLNFETEDEQQASEKAFDLFFLEWQKETTAKWWIDHRKTTVRDISKRIAELSETNKKE